MLHDPELVIGVKYHGCGLPESWGNLIILPIEVDGLIEVNPARVTQREV